MVDPAAAGQEEADPAEAGQGAAGQVAADARVEMATDPHSIVPVREATGRRSIARGQLATGQLSIARGQLATGQLSIARGQLATGQLSIARGVTIGRLATAPGKLIRRHLTARAANFGPSPIDLAEILVRRRSASEPRDLRATGRGRTGDDVTLDRPSNAAAPAAGRTRIVPGRLAPMADATGPAARADRRGRSTHARQGRRTSTRASSWVKETN